MKHNLIILFIVLFLITSYAGWYFSGRYQSSESVQPQMELTNYGVDRGQGNLLAVQPFMTPMDYSSEQRFSAAIEGYLERARKEGWLNLKTIVVFPEYIGTWLVVANEKRKVYQATTITEAMQAMVLCHPVSFLKELVFARTKAQDIVKYSLFKIKAKTAAGIYHRTFSGLARKYGVTIVAGSIVLPSPAIVEENLKCGSGRLYNVSVVYRPDGQSEAEIVRKAYPTSSELPFVAKASPDELPVFQTPAGRLGVLICADAWYPPAYTAVKRQKAEIIAVPSFKPSERSLNHPWGGYDANLEPEDVELDDIGKITEEEALFKYSLAGRLNSSGAKVGVNVFLRGELWDLGSDGYTIIVKGEQVIKGKKGLGAAIDNLWLP